MRTKKAGTFDSWIYMLVIFKQMDGKIIRKIPVKQCMKVPQFAEIWIQKNVIWDTEKFKFEGNRTFMTLKSDTMNFKTEWFINDEYKKVKKGFVLAGDYLNAIICQGYKEGWYRPREVMVLHSLIKKKEFYDRYQKFNYNKEL